MTLTDFLWGAIGILVGGFGWVLAFIFRGIVSGLTESRREIAALKDALPKEYAQRRDVDGIEARLTTAIQRLEDTLERGLDKIYEALDSKADKK